MILAELLREISAVTDRMKNLEFVESHQVDAAT